MVYTYSYLHDITCTCSYIYGDNKVRIDKLYDFGPLRIVPIIIMFMDGFITELQCIKDMKYSF